MDSRTKENDFVDESIPEASNKPGAKRRTSRAGSRSVATLNAEQLARKRANDREAQRSIRQRTKDHVERLENRIRELTEGQYVNLEEVQVRNAELERELRELKEGLLLNDDGTGFDYGGSPAQVPWNEHGAMSAYPPSSGGWSPTFSTPLSTTPESTANGSYTSGYVHMLPSPNDVVTLYNQPLEQQGDPSWASHSVSRDPRVRTVPTMRPPMSRALSHTPPLPQNLPAWELPVLLLPPSCPVDHLLTGLIQRQRTLLGTGASKTAIIGSHHLSLRILAYPELTEDGNPLSTVIANLVQRTSVTGLPEKAACLLVMYRLVQWQIAPSPETYANIPPWFTPRASQLVTPHPIWVTNIPFGKLRDQVIAYQDYYATEEFQAHHTACLSINWHKAPEDILVFKEDDVRLSDEFERHCMNLANWTLGGSFLMRYPELADFCNPAVLAYHGAHRHSGTQHY